MGTGFSYTSDPEQEKDYLQDMNAAAGEFVQLMKNLYATFPELASKPLYMTGESYAGKYIPKFSYELLQQTDVTFDLKASLIGDPYTAPLTQRTHTYLVP